MQKDDSHEDRVERLAALTALRTEKEEITFDELKARLGLSETRPGDEMVTVTLRAHVLAQTLDALVSEISERCYCAGWMSGIEGALQKYVPEIVASGVPHPYGQDEIEVGEATAILAMVTALGGWTAAWEVDR